MSATIPETMLLSDLLKPTGYDCPQDLQGKTFVEATEGDTPSPSVNSYNFYCWQGDTHTAYFTLSENPQVGDNAYSEDDSGSPDRYTPPVKIVSVSDTSIVVEGDSTLSRNENKDIIFTKS